MLDKKDIYCPLLEHGGAINFINEEYQPPRSVVIQAKLIDVICPHETICPFRNKYRRCLTEEIQLKYLQANN